MIVSYQVPRAAGMAMAREAWPNALNSQLFNSKVGVYFRGGLFPWGFISVGVYFLSKMKWGFFPWFFPQPHLDLFIDVKLLSNLLPISTSYSSVLSLSIL